MTIQITENCKVSLGIVNDSHHIKTLSIVVIQGQKAPNLCVWVMNINWREFKYQKVNMADLMTNRNN